MHKRSQHSFISRPELLCERPTAKLLPRKISCFLLNICVCCLLSRTPRPQVSLCGHCAFKPGGLAVLENTILLARTTPHTCTQGRRLPIEPGVHSDRGRCRSDWLTGCGVSWLCVCVHTHMHVQHTLWCACRAQGTAFSHQFSPPKAPGSITAGQTCARTSLTQHPSPWFCFGILNLVPCLPNKGKARSIQTSLL